MKPMTRSEQKVNVRRLFRSKASGHCYGLVVEGVGGFCVPLENDWSSAAFAVDLDLPVLLGVGMWLGSLNHAILIAQAVRERPAIGQLNFERCRSCDRACRRKLDDIAAPVDGSTLRCRHSPVGNCAYCDCGQLSQSRCHLGSAVTPHLASER
jgi:hypothetical protein